MAPRKPKLADPTVVVEVTVEQPAISDTCSRP